MKLRRKRLLVGLTSLTAAFLLGCGLAYYAFVEQAPVATAAVEPEVPAVVPVEEAYPHVLAPRETLFSTLRQLNVPAPVIHQIVEASKPVHNLSRLRPGLRFQLQYEGELDPQVVGVQFRLSAIEYLDVKKEEGAWVANKWSEQVDLEPVQFSGLVSSSLWDSAVRAQMDPNLISELADIFGWQVDFAREVRKNDRWRLTVERKFVRGQPIGWGSILAAEYENAGNLYQAVLFRQDGEEIGYFSPDGSSLRRMFLKSPIRFGRITSGFTMRRFHPVLKVNRPHLGVDYAAPIGTPIRSVGDGTIAFSGWSGGGGNVIKVRHNSTYETAYKHLSRFAPGIKRGSRVKQGQVIGYVGNTGLSTGPHLHFEFYQSGRYVDPLGKKFPSADPVPREHLAAFQAVALSELAGLPTWDQLASSTTEMASESLPQN